MTPPSPTTPLPSGYELLSPEITKLRPEGMRFRHKDSGPEEFWLFNVTLPITDDDIQKYCFIAPLGTTAMLSTPLPEARCTCGASVKGNK